MKSNQEMKPKKPNIIRDLPNPNPDFQDYPTLTQGNLIYQTLL